jgi:hypothetical protein
MKTIDRRRLIGGILSGAGVGLVLAPGTLAAMPIYSEVPDGLDDLVERDQVVVVGPGPRPRRRVWRCWWHRGRRVCGWRWV